jgi:hypothetical protein
MAVNDGLRWFRKYGFKHCLPGIPLAWFNPYTYCSFIARYRARASSKSMKKS